MMKRFVSASVLSVIAALSLSGCGSSVPKWTSDATMVNAGKHVCAIWNADGVSAKTYQQVKKYMATNYGISNDTANVFVPAATQLYCSNHSSAVLKVAR